MNSALQFLSLMQRAGKVASGEDAVYAAVRKGNPEGLLIIAQDASEGTKKKFTILAGLKSVPYVIFETKASLGAALGKKQRALLYLDDVSIVKTFLQKCQ